jgi:cold shock CspA family protein
LPPAARRGSTPITRGESRIATVIGRPPIAPVTGVVSDFDEHRGLGTVIGDDGSIFPFHCTAIVDGTRFVAPGTRVAFGIRPAHLGSLEARRLVLLQPSPE